MVITINRESLLEPLKNLVSVSEQRQTMPILGHVLLKITSGFCSLTSTDLEVQVSHTTETDVVEDVLLTVPSRKFFDVIRSLESPEIELDITDSAVLIKSGKSKFKVSSLSPEDFPITDSQVAEPVHIKSDVLLDLINNTSFSMGYQDARHFLNGLYLEFNGSNILTVATDGHRLAFSNTQSSAQLPNQTCIIPRKCVLEIKRILSSFNNISDILSEVSINSKNITVKSGSYTVISKLIEGNYPDYKKVFPESLPNKLTADKASLKSALQRLSIMSSEQYKGVKFKLNKDTLNLSTINSQNESGDETIECIYGGNEIEIGFNLSYLLETLDVIKSPNIEINLGTPDSGCLVMADGNDSSKYIIMPMRV